MIFHANLQSNLSNSFRAEDFQVFAFDLPHLSNFDRGLSKDYSCEVLSKLADWFQRRCHLKHLLTMHYAQFTPNKDQSQ